ncbi:hypothetical protein Ngar_c03470 [Candidatus Nitrososphaera gargensis Ga9.2]|uniref:Uncharacterized protein n=1 Tax=Nitrososphaera gargensis (strain Ga9.2) TaxID=1237085 RepID=K0ICG4_NITGG|nr:hypothetical protein Ngar_c03170 [Candidatus Nitrososphaera gargensis Ga9.2]AFU57295.1 hypothetical protein Ngar_c03470 [Candidatus Nitrososphaera gargensis Ga9.2]
MKAVASNLESAISLSNILSIVALSDPVAVCRIWTAATGAFFVSRVQLCHCRAVAGVKADPGFSFWHVNSLALLGAFCKAKNDSGDMASIRFVRRAAILPLQAGIFASILRCRHGSRLFVIQRSCYGNRPPCLNPTARSTVNDPIVALALVVEPLTVVF